MTNRKKSATPANAATKRAIDELIYIMFLTLPPEKFVRDLCRLYRLKERDQNSLAEAFVGDEIAISDELPQMPNVDTQLAFERILLDLRAFGYGLNCGMIIDALKEIGPVSDQDNDRLYSFLNQLLSNWESEVIRTI